MADPKSDWGRDAAKSPDDFAENEDRMTQDQAQRLRSLAARTGEPVDEDMTRDEAERRIEELEARTRKG